MSDSWCFRPVAIARTEFAQKFAIPRQSGLAPGARARIELVPAWRGAGALEGLEGVSHLWLQFVFHANAGARAASRVRPPRLGGNRRIGVFASRASHRPNPIGLSLVELLAIEDEVLLVGGADLLDRTPVLDIKPYLPWADARAAARNPLAPAPPARLAVDFAAAARAALAALPVARAATLRSLIADCLAQDPRPAYRRDEPARVHGARLAGCEVRWCHPAAGQVRVLSIETDAPGAH